MSGSTKRPPAIGLAMVGAGNMARRHLAALRGHPRLRCEVLVHSPAGAAGAALLAGEFGFGRATPHLDKALTDPAVDLLYVCTPNSQHGGQVAQALAAGKHVFCEKPLCPTAKEALELLRMRRPGQLLAVGMNCRFRDQFARVQGRVRAGEIGAIFLLRGTYVSFSGMAIAARQRDWWFDPANGPFVLNSGGIHTLDLLAWIGGEVAEVFARASRAVLGGAVGDDTFSILLRFAAGAIGELFVTNVARRPNEMRLEIYGTRGTFLGQELYTDGGPQVQPAEVLAMHQPKIDLLLQFEDLLRAIDEGRPPLNTAEAAVHNLLVCEAAAVSAATGCPVPVDSACLYP